MADRAGGRHGSDGNRAFFLARLYRRDLSMAMFCTAVLLNTLAWRWEDMPTRQTHYENRSPRIKIRGSFRRQCQRYEFNGSHAISLDLHFIVVW